MMLASEGIAGGLIRCSFTVFMFMMMCCHEGVTCGRLITDLHAKPEVIAIFFP